MTKYECEFDLEEFVWTMIGPKAKQVQVQEHKLTASMFTYKKGNLIYMVKTEEGSLNAVSRFPRELFKSKSDLLASL